MVLQLISIPNDAFSFTREIVDKVTNEACGYWVFATVRMMFRNPASPAEQDEGGDSMKYLASVSVTRSSKLAIRMLVYVRYQSGEKDSGKGICQCYKDGQPV